MKVNRNNYEVWMIDYFDGKLNASEIADLMAFIEVHEDIREEFELFSNETLDKEEVTFSIEGQAIALLGNVGQQEGRLNAGPQPELE